MRLLFKRKINLLLLWLFVFPRPKDRFCRVVTREKVCLFSFTKAELRQQKFESKRSLCCHEVEKAFAFFFFVCLEEIRMYGVGNETLMRLQKCAFSALGRHLFENLWFLPFFPPFLTFFFKCCCTQFCVCVACTAYLCMCMCFSLFRHR